MGRVTLGLVCATSEVSFPVCEAKPPPKAGGGWCGFAAVPPRFDVVVPPHCSPSNDRELTATVLVGVGRLACWPERSGTDFAVGNRTTAAATESRLGGIAGISMMLPVLVLVLPGVECVDGWGVLVLLLLLMMLDLFLTITCLSWY